MHLTIRFVLAACRSWTDTSIKSDSPGDGKQAEPRDWSGAQVLTGSCVWLMISEEAVVVLFMLRMVTFDRGLGRVERSE